MDKLITILTAVLLLAACTKESDAIKDQDYLSVTIEDTQISTKSILSGEKGTSFTSGDRIKVYDTGGKSAIYKYRTKKSGKAVFQKVSGDDGFNKANFEAAFYPADSVKSYNSSSKTFRANFGAKQKYASNSFPNGSAPMISFTKLGDTLTFSNCFAVVRFAFKYNSEPAKPLTLDKVKLESSAAELYGTFDFTSTATTYVSGGGKSVELTDCSSGGALSTSEKYYYIAVPGLASGTSDMTVTATPTTDVPFFGKFTASAAGDNKIARNNILRMSPFQLDTIGIGGSTYSLADWVNPGNIIVGQITLSSSEVSVKKGETKKIQIFGVTEWDKITTQKISGNCFTFNKTKDGDKYYISVTGDASKTGTGEIFVNDQITNSGSYLNITVTD